MLIWLTRAINYLVYLILRSFLFLGDFLAMKPTFGVVWLIGNIGYYLAGSRRRLALENLKIAFGNEKSEKELRRICRRSFVNLAYSGAEFLFFKRITRNWQKHFTFEGAEQLEECIRNKQAFFVFGGHLGAWMLIAMVPKKFGIRGGVVIRPQRNPYLHRFLENLVGEFGGVMINTRGTGKVIEQMIMNGELVGFYMDQSAKKEQGIPVDFFGLPAYSHVVPGYLAWKHKIPMFPYWMIRKKPGYIHAVYKPPVEFVYSGDKEEDIKEVTQRIVKEVEKAIRQYPEQWLWAHNRWKKSLGEKKKDEEKEKRKREKLAEAGVYLTSYQVIKEMDQEIGEAKDETGTGSA